MARKDPVIVTGLRSTGDSTDPRVGEVSPNTPAAAAVPAKPGVRRYESAGVNFRLMLLDEPDIVINGHVVKGRKASAQFVDGKYETDNPEYQRIIEGSRAFARKEVWDADKLASAALKAAEDAALRTVENNPALMAKIRERLAMKGAVDSLELPPVEEPVGATS